MKELVTTEQAEHVLRLLATALPAAGVLIGLLAGVVRRRLLAGALVGLLAGLVGPFAWLLWKMYGGIVGHFGLDSVKGLLVSLGAFVLIGLVIGAALGWAFSLRRAASAGGS